MPSQAKEPPVSTYLAAFFLICLLMLAGWLFSLPRRNVNIVDSLWGLGFVLAAWLTFLSGDGFAWRGFLVCVLVSAWGIRLAVHLGLRNLGKPEDRRYAKMRDKRGEQFAVVSLYLVFGLQAVLLWLVSLVAQRAVLGGTPELTALDVLGVLLWSVGFTFEAVADAQLACFKADPANKGRVMDQGLWGYSRHPNYFGEMLVWWGIWLIAAASGGWWSIISPMLITFLLLKVSGVVMTEAGMTEHRPGYADYQRRVSAFVPWFPKKGAAD